jgi:D-sedoheptulose 7-phosphate isomerase
MSFTTEYLSEVAAIAADLDVEQVDACAGLLSEARRVFVLGNGGSAANASHFVNDLRKIAGIEAYAPTDNVAEFSARANDDGWHTAFVGWLKTSHLDLFDLVFVLSVGGGSVRTSPNIVAALVYAREAGAQIAGIVGRSEGYTKQVADACIVVPTVNEEHVTPHAESFQSVLCHLLVWHPALQS